MRLARRDLVLGGLALLATTPSSRGAAADAEHPSIVARNGPTIEITDDLGTRLNLKTPLSRVAVFNRYTAEFVRAIAGIEAIVGIGADAEREPTYWPNLHAAGIGQGQSHPNYEAIIALRPDAVMVPRNGDWDRARRTLAPFGIPVIVVTAWDALKHEANVTLLGALFAREDRAKALNAFHSRILDIVRSRTKNIDRNRVYFEEVGDYKTVLKGSGWHDMIEIAGGTNAFGDAGFSIGKGARGNVQAFDVDPEHILLRRPDLIVKLQPNQYRQHPRAFTTAILEAVASRPGFRQLPAVASGRVYSMSYYLAGACSKIVGALQLAKWLYPDRFADIDPSDAMREWLEGFQKVPYPGGYWDVLQMARR